MLGCGDGKHAEKGYKPERAETNFPQGRPDQSTEAGSPGQPGGLRMVYMLGKGAGVTGS